MTTISIVLMCISAALIIYVIVFMIITPKKAKAFGVIGKAFSGNIVSFIISALLVILDLCLMFCYIFKANEYKALLEEGEVRGAAAFLEYGWGEGMTVPEGREEEYYDRYSRHYTEEREKSENLAWIFGVGALAYGLSLVASMVYITREGLMFIGRLKPKKTSAVTEKGKLCFYIDGGDEPKAVLKLRASEENLRLYSEFITEEIPVREIRTEQI